MHKEQNMMIQNQNLLIEREYHKKCIAFCRILTKHIVASYYSYIPQLMLDQNLPQYHSLSESPIDTGLLGNTPVFHLCGKIYQLIIINTPSNTSLHNQLLSYSQYNHWDSYITICTLVILSISQLQLYNTEFSIDVDHAKNLN